ncbi:MAG: alpha-amylase family glycosyl hydrolase [Candidatus Melainabacteria bacterium]|nr:alpha-amylase family glycosyl hydrolase [Candidatus Melainabacteria bacterium]
MQKIASTWLTPAFTNTATENRGRVKGAYAEATTLGRPLWGIATDCLVLQAQPPAQQTLRQQTSYQQIVGYGQVHFAQQGVPRFAKHLAEQLGERFSRRFDQPILPEDAKTWPLGVHYLPEHQVTVAKVWAPQLDNLSIGIADPFSPDERQTFLQADHRTEMAMLAEKIPNDSTHRLPMQSDGEGHYLLKTDRLTPGTLYKLVTSSHQQLEFLPDHAGRQFPLDIEGPAEVINPKDYAWKVSPGSFRPAWADADGSIHPEKMVMYQFPMGYMAKNFDEAIRRLDHIQALGVNTVYLLPDDEFPGQQSKGYNTTHYAAPENTYGGFFAENQFVDACHERGIAVIVDTTLLSHTAVEGNYFNRFDSQFVGGPINPQTGAAWFKTDWGDGFNLKNPHAAEFIQQNVWQKLVERNFDGIRFDMVSAGYKPQGFYTPEAVKVIREMAQMVHQEISPSYGPKFLMYEDPNPDCNITLPSDNKHPNGLGAHVQMGYGLSNAWPAFFTRGRQDEWRLWGGEQHATTPSLDYLSWRIWEEYKEPGQQIHQLNNRLIRGMDHDIAANNASRRLIHIAGLERGRIAGILPLLLPGCPLIFGGEELTDTNFAYTSHEKDPGVRHNTIQHRGEKHGEYSGDRLNPFATETLAISKVPFSRSEWDQRQHIYPHEGAEKRLSWEQRQQLTRLYQAAAHLRLAVPALWNGDRNEMTLYNIGQGEDFRNLSPGEKSLVQQAIGNGNTLEILRHDRNEWRDNVLIVANLSDAQQPQGQPVYFPRGTQWTEIFNSNDPRWTQNLNKATNDEKVFHDGLQTLALPPWTVAVFAPIAQAPRYRQQLMASIPCPAR